MELFVDRYSKYSERTGKTQKALLRNIHTLGVTGLNS